MSLYNKKIKIETDRFVVYETEGRLAGFEKPARVLSDDDRVLVAELGEDVARSTAEALDKLDIGALWKNFRRVGIKVNLCGGLVGCPSTFSDPLVVEGIIEHARSHGLDPFVCEADMRGFVAGESLVRRRGELQEVLDRTGTRFVNLSRHPIPFTCLGLEGGLTFPEELLDPETAIVSMAVPKDHWECGISMSQKNMYGAISERRKALYHRGWSRIDRAIAAAVRIVRPDLAIVGGRVAGTGWGPHFCVPVDWNRIVVGADALRVDKFMADVYNYPYPYEKIFYSMINARGEDVGCNVVEGSAEIPDDAKRLIRRYAMTPMKRFLWKLALFPQYFIPHSSQHFAAPLLENAAGGFHRYFVDSLAKKQVKRKKL